MTWSKKALANENKMIITKKCPNCNHKKIVQQFTLDHYRCCKCSYIWKE